jgi:hypothetical protein
MLTCNDLGSTEVNIFDDTIVVKKDVYSNLVHASHHVRMVETHFQV